MSNKLPQGQALIVGIDDYPDDPLCCCVNDACEVANALSFPEYGFDVNLLRNNEVSRVRLMTALTQLFTGSSAQRLLFYFAGHGRVTAYGTYIETPDGTDVEPGLDLPLLSRLVRTCDGRGCQVLVSSCCGKLFWINPTLN